MKPPKDLFYHVPLVRVHVLRDSAMPQQDALADTPEAVFNLWRNTIEKDPRHNGDVESIYCFHLNARRRGSRHSCQAHRPHSSKLRFFLSP